MRSRISRSRASTEPGIVELAGQPGWRRQPLVHGAVGEAVGVVVVLPAHVADHQAWNRAAQAQGALVEPAQMRRLDLVAARELAHQELAVGVEGQDLEAAASGEGERRQQRRILGDVVGGAAEVAADLDRLGNAAGAGNLENDAEAGLARIAARAAIDPGPRRIRSIGLSLSPLTPLPLAGKRGTAARPHAA